MAGRMPAVVIDNGTGFVFFTHVHIIIFSLLDVLGQVSPSLSIKGCALTITPMGQIAGIDRQSACTSGQIY